MPKESKLIVDRLCYAIEGGRILSDISFTLKSGEVSCLLGPSGCGKTTLLKLIAGLLSPDRGRVCLDDEEISRLNGDQRLDRHPAMMVFQDLGLFPHMSVAANIAYGLSGNSSVRKQKVQQILEQLDLKGFAARYPHELSGGQQQRIALARTLVLNPAVLLLDEPFANLDTALRQPLAEEILSLLRQRGIITLLVTHDREDALSLGDYIGVMGAGKILQWDTPERLLFQPGCPDVARFTGHNSVIRGWIRKPGTVETVLGTMAVEKPEKTPAEGTLVGVLLRCSDMRITDSEQARKATVIYRSFEAEQLVYALRLANGEQVFALACSQPGLRVGDMTRIELLNPKVAIYY